jgi:SagB-type dehydrogenase family enzyme
MTRKAPLYLRYHKQTLFAGVGGQTLDLPLSDEQEGIFYKAYSRFVKVTLPPPLSESSQPLQKIIFERRSERTFAKDMPLDIAEISRILSGLQITSAGPGPFDARRGYPSAGSCYPLEVYLLPIRVRGLKRHLYHYHVRTHSLEELWPISAKDFKACFPEDPWCSAAGVVVILTACHTRGYLRFLERAYQFCLLEAGHAAQNVQLLAAAEGLNSCSYGSFHDQPVMRFLDINPNEEIPLSTIFIGKPHQ